MATTPIMTKTLFLTELEKRLAKLPPEERDNALAYYTEYFEEAGEEQEAAVVAELGSPAVVASKIIGEFAIRDVETAEQPRTSGRPVRTFWLVLAAVFASPIALPLAAAGVAVLLALAAVLFALFVSFAAVGLALLLSGVLGAVLSFGVASVDIATTLFYCGIGLLLAALGSATCVGTWLLSRKTLKGIITFVSRRLIRRAAVTPVDAKEAAE